MSAQRWCCKEEVLRDLAEATGRRVDDLDEGYLVVGERPPPKHVIEEDDDEINLLFGGLENGRHIQGDSSPDLEGITEMLRMVNDYDGEEDGNDNGLVNPADTIVTISKITKLNPNVREFVPKCAINSNSSSDHLDNKENLNNIKLNNYSAEAEDIDTGKVNNVESNDFKALTEKIKKQISDSLKSDSFENKKQKNVAIATLLKLNAAKKASNSTQHKTSDTNHALKLMTPDDFQNNICIPKDKVLTTEHPSTDTTNSLSLDSENNSKCNNSSCSTPVEHKTSEPNRVLSPEIKASIDKVNKWLEEPTKKKSPTVFSSPVGFKRKESKAPKSPATNVHKSAISNSIGQYKPSEYAADLSKQYLERNKAKNVKRNNWLDLDVILKEKDLEIRKRLEQESEQSRD